MITCGRLVQSEQRRGHRQRRDRQKLRNGLQRPLHGEPALPPCTQLARPYGPQCFLIGYHHEAEEQANQKTQAENLEGLQSRAQTATDITEGLQCFLIGNVKNESEQIRKLRLNLSGS